MSEERKDLWEFIPLKEYEKPAEPVREAARSRAKAFWDRIRQNKPALPPPSIQVELRTFPQEVLDTIAPAPTWEVACRALIPVLQGWVESDRKGPFVQIVVGPPGSGTRQLLECWARETGRHTLPAPTPQQILAGVGSWGDQLQGEDGPPLVLPCLESCYLRHYNGLTFLAGFPGKAGQPSSSPPDRMQ
jgi:hypothetical protein